MNDRQPPKYMQLKQEILSWLTSGQLKPNDQMPSEHEIAGRFGMSRQTVRQTLSELEKDGWLYRLQGKGTFVAQPNTGSAQETQTIGMITTYISDYIFPHIVRGAEGALRRRGFGLTLSSTDNDKQKERENLQFFLSHRTRGLIIEPTKSAQGNPNLDLYLSLHVQGIPFLMINERYPELHCPCLKMDDEAGGYAATKHLFDLGHKHIAGFFKTDDLQGANRLKGFIRAHIERGHPLQRSSVTQYTTETKSTLPYESALSMLQLEERPTAFVCYNDELAVRLLEAVRRTGLSVPEDLSIVGFDDSSLSTATEVKLTTIVHPKTEMGEAAAEMLLSMMEGKPGDTVKDIIYVPELVVRDSTRPI
ncbi:GntR family transcriptional regulator [Paenibacillus thermotolerans]|uniref:GntR family transcriptional regulator n=1 Tax=Paenibacillus thermotolerans TaxID=3027807 RepID=UPI0023688E1F|nr:MULTISPECIES: GntR family transcriptional regulator [unclassified Paenibacillus]